MRSTLIAPLTCPSPTVAGGKALLEMSDDELFVSLRSKTRHFFRFNSMREVARHGLQEIVLLISLHNYSIRRVVARYGATASVGDALYEAIVDEVACFTLHKVCLGTV